jgi:hypothetical protein
MKNNLSETMDWALWFYWIMATAIGWVFGSIFFNGIPVIMAGAAISALQWAVLHGRIKNAWRWVIFSTAGWMGGYILFVSLFSTHMGLLLGPLMGISVGIPQWFILRKEVNWAGWWIIMSAIGWTTGITVMPGLLTSGALPGALTGLTLVLLLRYSPALNKN